MARRRKYPNSICLGCVYAHFLRHVQSAQDFPCLSGATIMFSDRMLSKLDLQVREISGERFRKCIFCKTTCGLHRYLAGGFCLAVQERGYAKLFL